MPLGGFPDKSKFLLQLRVLMACFLVAGSIYVIGLAETYMPWLAILSGGLLFFSAATLLFPALRDF